MKYLITALGLVWSACAGDTAFHAQAQLRADAVVAAPDGVAQATGTATVSTADDSGGAETRDETTAETLEATETHETGPDTSDTGDTGETDATTVNDVPDVTETVAPPPVALPSASTLASIRDDMDDALAAPAIAGHPFSGLVVDLDTGATIYADRADALLIPASNTKVFTTAAALSLLGPDHRMLSRIFMEGTLGADGTLSGNLHLHSEHDFTWSRWFYSDARFPLDRMVDALWRDGLRKVSGHLDVWGAYLYDGYHYGSYDATAQRGRAIAAFRAALTARGITVVGANVDHATMDLPPGTEGARWESIPLWVGVWAILRKSHNEMADILMRHIGYVVGGGSDYAAGAAAVIDWLGEAGVDTTGLALYDGSGLDVRNRVSARQLVSVYRVMLASAAGARWKTALSVGGAQGPASTDAGDQNAIVTTNTGPYNGTLAYRLTGADTAGRVFGKSGTNAGITTSGVLFNRYDGRRYAFAFEMNEVDDYTASRAAQDEMVTAVSGDNLEIGTRPEAPVLGCMRGVGADRVEVTWSAVAGIGSDTQSGYFVWTSRDGLAWDPAARLFVRGTTATVAVPGGAALYVRVTSASLAGESDPSDTYAAKPGGARRTLIVDANDRWQHQPTNENVMGAAHAFVGEYARALESATPMVPFDSCANEQVLVHELEGWDTVLWMTGEESAADESFSAPEEDAIAAYVAAGGNLLVSGAEVAWDLAPAGNSGATAGDATFLESTLHASYVADDAGTYVAEPSASGIFANLPASFRTLGFWTPGAIFVAFPDVLAPAGGATTCLTYLGPGTVAGVQYAGDARVVALGFPFESIDGAPARAAVLGAIMQFFAW